MKTRKIFLMLLINTLLISGVIITGCGGKTIKEEVKTGSSTAVISGLTIGGKSATLGTPAQAPKDLKKKGSITLESLDWDDALNTPKLYIDTPAITFRASKDAVTLKYFQATDDAVPAAGAFTAIESGGELPKMTNGDRLWLEATTKSAKQYFCIVITVKYVSPLEFKSSPANRELTLAEWNAAPAEIKALSVEMVRADLTYSYQWYSNTSFSNTGGSAIAEQVNASYTPTITVTGSTYYYVAVTYKGTTLNSNPAVISIVTSRAQAPTAFSIGDTRLNYVRGVGGTGSFMFRTGDRADASPDADVRYIDLLMGEIGCNILRIMVQDDYLNYIKNEVQSRNFAQFPHNARDNFFPVIRKVNEYGGYVFANPWTAPHSMKVKDPGGSVAKDTADGGYLRETGPNYVDYAEHLRNFLKWLNDNDAPIFAIGILNEPDFGGAADYEGMGMSATVTRDWFKTVGNFTTQKVRNREAAGVNSSILDDNIIPGYGGGGPTHHVLAMSGDCMGDVPPYMDVQLNDAKSNNYIELIGRHYYGGGAARYTKVVGNPPHNARPTAWFDRPQLSYEGPFETESLARSPQMYAPGSEPGNIKREVWQTEHDFNYASASVNPPAGNPQNYWNSAFAAMNDVDWCVRVAGESVFDWWFSSSYSGLVTSYSPAGFPPYTITPRGRAFAHYARYINETWFLPITRSRGTINFNATSSQFDAGATDPKISAFEDVNGKFISIVMFTPSYSTASANGGGIASSFGGGGTFGNDDPTRGSTNVGRIAVTLPDGFVAASASALRTYGNGNADSRDASWTAAKPVPSGSPRYWIDEPVYLSVDGKTVEVELPPGNIISIMAKGDWTPEYLAANPRQFEQRVRPYSVK